MKSETLAEDVGFPSRGGESPVELEGLLQLPGTGEGFPGVVVCHPHPAGGGEMDVPLLSLIAESLSSSGFAVLRFNFGGVGGSGGVFSDGSQEPDDIAAAVSFLSSNEAVDDRDMSVAGWSFGAWMCLSAVAGGLDVKRLVAIAPPLVAYDWRREVSRIAGSRVERNYIVGDSDDFCPLVTLREFAASISGRERERISVIAGADHFLFGREGEVVAQVAGILTGV